MLITNKSNDMRKITIKWKENDKSKKIIKTTLKYGQTFCPPNNSVILTNKEDYSRYCRIHTPISKSTYVKYSAHYGAEYWKRP